MFLKTIFSLTIFSLLFFACKKDQQDDDLIPPPEPPSIDSCVVWESITSQDTGFYVYTPGNVGFGFAEAIKLNKEWKASAFLIEKDDYIELKFRTFWDNQISLPHEHLTFYLASFSLLHPACFPIKECFFQDTIREENTIIGHYSTTEGDVFEDDYFVDTMAENNLLEIIEVDTLEKKITGKFSVSFVIDTTWGQKPWNPTNVRFFNGSFEASVWE